MNAYESDPRITAYVFGELSPDERQGFENELARSAELRREVEETRSTIDWAGDALATGSNDSLRDEQASALRSAALAAAQNEHESSPVVNAMEQDPHVERPLPNPPAAQDTRGGWKAMLVIVASLLVVASMSVFAYWQSTTETALLAEREVTEHALDGNIPANEVRSQADLRFSIQATNEEEPAEFDPQATDLALTKKEMIVDFGRVKTAQEALANVPLDESPTTTTYSMPDGGTVLLGGIRRSAQGQSSTTEIVESKRVDRLSADSLALMPLAARERYERRLQLGQPTDNFGFDGDPDEGQGPGVAGDEFERIIENDFIRADREPLSTFSIDVDTASYAKVRNYLQQLGRLPRPDAVRIEELINYFTYDYSPPADEHPFASNLAVGSCPWDSRHRLVRVAIKGKEIAFDQRPASNLVFLLDVSGSMDNPNKLPLVKKGMRMLIDQLGENDRLAIVVYAGAAGLVLESTPCNQKEEIVQSLEQLNAGGSTNGGEGIALAYREAMDHFIPGGVNRILLCTDGDFNVGTTGTDALVRMVEENAKANVDLTVLGFGMGNHNDSMLEQITNKGNGNYAFIDSEQEAKKVLVEQINGTLVTIAKDVKIQVEFNPTQVYAYRLLGYENRLLAAQDFNDDTKDAGEIGAGHTVTALYEVVPVAQAASVEIPEVDPLKYQAERKPAEGDTDELMTLKLRYKLPGENESTKLEFPLVDSDLAFSEMDRDFRFSAAVAGWGMLLRTSKFKGDLTYGAVLEIATAAAQDDRSGYRGEFLELVRRSQEVAGQN